MRVLQERIPAILLMMSGIPIVLGEPREYVLFPDSTEFFGIIAIDPVNVHQSTRLVLPIACIRYPDFY